jgi:hypothetical protein
MARQDRNKATWPDRTGTKRKERRTVSGQTIILTSQCSELACVGENISGRIGSFEAVCNEVFRASIVNWELSNVSKKLVGREWRYPQVPWNIMLAWPTDAM